ncbi:hypothetical protein MBAV_003796 [Candidatus Magnetobacterium bavaricum]|uniref:Uncharacterized protein n=1 Tax=Candidatus Magnetobacterium bavaricum TaxID=29290 RepID=A0A0F3GPW0_9BACT|nr:hypothetical protein MBAV_003796 [Candidatus Magnetobacterium bavaricum]
MSEPFISQITTSPVFAFRNRTSLLPSPSKSFLGFLPSDRNSMATTFSAVMLTVHWLPIA